MNTAESVEVHLRCQCGERDQLIVSGAIEARYDLDLAEYRDHTHIAFSDGTLLRLRCYEGCFAFSRDAEGRASYHNNCAPQFDPENDVEFSTSDSVCLRGDIRWVVVGRMEQAE